MYKEIGVTEDLLQTFGHLSALPRYIQRPLSDCDLFFCLSLLTTAQNKHLHSKSCNSQLAASPNQRMFSCSQNISIFTRLIFFF